MPYECNRAFLLRPWSATTTTNPRDAPLGVGAIEHHILQVYAFQIDDHAKT